MNSHSSHLSVADQQGDVANNSDRTTSAVTIGVLGLGTVGGGVVSVLHTNAAEIARRTGRHIRIKQAAAKEYDTAAIQGLEQIDTISADGFSVVNDPEIQVVVELIGGCEIARELLLQAIRNGKHVVTANKALIALHGNELFAAAQQAGVQLCFEAAVAGGIPIIKVLREGLAANRIDWVAGIINGTANYILTAMRTEGKTFATALAEAQESGYAEADPGFDIQGNDAAHKLTILGSLAFGIPLQFDRVWMEGITHIEPQDMQYAERLGYCIKHLGIARRSSQGIELRVHPALVAKDQLLARVDGVMNAVMVHSNALGPSLYCGAGAGAEPTASAVVADVIDVIRTVEQGRESVPYLAFRAAAENSLPVLAMPEVTVPCYLRMQVADHPGSLAHITDILGNADISIESVFQEDTHGDNGTVPVVVLTEAVAEKTMNATLAKLESLADITGNILRIRVETLR